MAKALSLHVPPCSEGDQTQDAAEHDPRSGSTVAADVPALRAVRLKRYADYEKDDTDYRRDNR